MLDPLFIVSSDGFISIWPKFLGSSWEFDLPHFLFTDMQNKLKKVLITINLFLILNLAVFKNSLNVLQITFIDYERVDEF